MAIYKRFYKNAGYQHFPTATGFDLKSAAEYVQIKTLKNPDGAIGAMKQAVDALALLPTPPNGLKLHILKKPGSASNQLQASLSQYIANHPSGKAINRKRHAWCRGLDVECEAWDVMGSPRLWTRLCRC